MENLYSNSLREALYYGYYARQAFLVSLLSCFGRHFLRALQQNRAHTRLLYLLNDSCKSP